MAGLTALKLEIGNYTEIKKSTEGEKKKQKKAVKG